MAVSFDSEDKMDGIDEAPAFVPLDGIRPQVALGMSWGPGNRIAICGTKYKQHQPIEKVCIRRKTKN
jgi:hypothetical protein